MIWNNVECELKYWTIFNFQFHCFIWKNICFVEIIFENIDIFYMNKSF